MMSRIILLAGLVSSTAAAQPQAPEQNYLHNRTIMERVPLASPTGNSVMLGSLSVSTPGLVGDVYLTPDYRIATFWLYDNNVAQGFATKLDLQRNEFDIYLGKGSIKALSGTKVKSLVWADSLSRTPQYFVNAQEYKNGEGVPYIGFFQILAEGELTLLKLTTVTFKPADHNPTHYTGSKDNRFIKRSELYYASGTYAVELPNRKGILKLMGSHKAEIEQFIKINEINMANERHIVILFEFYDNLTRK